MQKEIGVMQKIMLRHNGLCCNKKPDDFVIATGKTYTVKKFLEMVAKKLRMKIVWKGKGINTRGYYKGKIIIECNKKYFRPSEVNFL